MPLTTSPNTLDFLLSSPSFHEHERGLQCENTGVISASSNHPKVGAFDNQHKHSWISSYLIHPSMSMRGISNVRTLVSLAPLQTTQRWVPLTTSTNTLDFSSYPIHPSMSMRGVSNVRTLVSLVPLQTTQRWVPLRTSTNTVGFPLVSKVTSV